jgi:hypothetical protein
VRDSSAQHPAVREGQLEGDAVTALAPRVAHLRPPLGEAEILVGFASAREGRSLLQPVPERLVRRQVNDLDQAPVLPVVGGVAQMAGPVLGIFAYRRDYVVEGLSEGVAIRSDGETWQQDAPATTFGNDLSARWTHSDQEVPEPVSVDDRSAQPVSPHCCWDASLGGVGESTEVSPRVGDSVVMQST